MSYSKDTSALHETLGWRTKGIDSWEILESLGRRNHEALAGLLSDAAGKSLTQGDRSEAADIRRLLDRLVSRTSGALGDKPLLPRLRRESFRRGEEVSLYLGDLPNVEVQWASGRVVSIEKSYRKEWRRSTPNSGYYWRISVELAEPVEGLPKVLSFSTSEPRALSTRDLEWLLHNVDTDPVFVHAWASSAERSWKPLWSEELGLDVETEAIDPRSWLVAGATISTWKSN